MSVGARRDARAFHGTARPPNAAALSAALAAAGAALAAGVHHEAVTADAAGGVAVWYERSAEYVVVECYNDGAIELAWADADGSLGSEVGTVDSAGRLVESLTIVWLHRLFQAPPAALTAV
jgi:hypothetical protein